MSEEQLPPEQPAKEPSPNPYAFTGNAAAPEPGPSPAKLLPFSRWLPLAGGVLAGMALRLVYSGRPGGMFAAMMGSFIYLAPLIVGAVTVYLAERRQRRSWLYYIWAPFVANVFFVLGTLIIMIEGLICAVLIVPLFATIGSVGGLIMGAICRRTNWPKQALYGIGALPLILGLVEAALPLPQRFGTVERRIVIDAPPVLVWQQIWQVTDIKPKEVDRAWIYRIGVPVPLAAVTRQTPSGPVRRITMTKDVYFDQVVTDLEPERYVHWRYRFYADSFPPRALDDHVMVGGDYFDMTDTSYRLTPKGTSTELEIFMRYRLSTQFNWYADWWAQRLFGNFEEAVLEFYCHRSQAAIAGASDGPKSRCSAGEVSAGH